MNKWPMVPLGDVLELQRRWVKVDPFATYEEIGVRCFGKGIFHKTAVDGMTLGSKRVLHIEPGDLVFNNVFAWEGAVAVAGLEENGKIGSHRFVTYTVNSKLATPQFLQLYFMTEAGLDVLRKASPGSAGRNKTLGLERFISQSIPLPPLSEQEKIVEWIDAVANRVEAAKGLHGDTNTMRHRLVSSLHDSLSQGVVGRMGDYLELDEDRVPIETESEYPQIGLRGFGGGMFFRETLRGDQTKYKHFNRLYESAVVLSQVKGWEGAIAITPTEFDGHFSSPEYRTFRCKESVLPEYLTALIPSPWFWNKLAGLTRGVGARRERIRPEMFLEMAINMPSLAAQKEAVKMLRRLDETAQLSDAIPERLEAIIPSVLNEIFNGEADG